MRISDWSSDVCSSDLIHADAVVPGARVLLVDDVLATGGTLFAALALARQQGATVVGATVLLEIAALQGRARWDASVALEATVACCMRSSSEERRVGKECVSPGRSRWWPSHTKTTDAQQHALETI